MNPLAKELNQVMKREHSILLEMLSELGRNLYFPKGILSQSAEAKKHAHRINATIGIATEAGSIMYLDSLMSSLGEIAPADALTYAPSFGVPELREMWREALFTKNPSLKGHSISLPVVTSGITHGVAISADMWVDPEDVVIIPEMMWGNYNMIFSVRKKARIVTYPLFSASGGFNLEAFERCLRENSEGFRKLVVVLNFPHNPTGYTATKKEGERIALLLTEIARAGTKVIALMDDAYFGLFYEEDSMQESLFALLCNSIPNLIAVKLDGATKENFAWGLRVGFITYGVATEGDQAAIYNALERKTAGAVRGSISNASHIGQRLLLKSMQSDAFAGEQAEKKHILKSRALEVKAVLSDPKYSDAWDVYPFNSGYFMCLRLKTVLSEDLRRHLLEQYGVGLVALGQHDLRVAFSCIESSQVKELFDTIFQGVKDLTESR